MVKVNRLLLPIKQPCAKCSQRLNASTTNSKTHNFMPTEKEATTELTPEQKKLAQDLWERAGNGEFSKDPSNPPVKHHLQNKPFPDDDKFL